MSTQRIYRQQLRTNDFVQPIHIGDSKVMKVAENGINEKFIDIWFEGDYDRMDHLPNTRNFRLLQTGATIGTNYEYVDTVVMKSGKVHHIYQEIK